MYKLGGLFGLLILLFYGLALLNYILKFMNKNYKEQIKNNKRLNKIFPKILKPIVKYHRIFGLTTILMILIHFSLQFSLFGLNITGAIAASLMILQFILGSLTQLNRKNKFYLHAHRLIATLLILAILSHLIIK